MEGEVCLGTTRSFLSSHDPSHLSGLGSQSSIAYQLICAVHPFSRKQAGKAGKAGKAGR